MGTYSIKMPDVGEGVAEAELVEWHVKSGDLVSPDDILADVMTDKATVEIPSSVAGTVIRLGADVGDTVAIGSELISIEVEGDGNVPDAPAPAKPKPPESPAPEAAKAPDVPAPAAKPKETAKPVPAPGSGGPAGGPARRGSGKPVASPSVRRRARELGVNLRMVPGSGPAGRIGHDDLDAFVAAPETSVRGARQRDDTVTEIKVAGLRKVIADRMTVANQRIPHITIVEEADVTALEELRETLNADNAAERGKLTVLPFIMLALVNALRRQPALNAHFDDDAGVIRRFGGIHIGVATQTDNGLMVPVVRHAEARDLWDCAADLSRIAAAARDGSARREDLGGSTITISSLGPLGALATTPIINRPEVAIVGINRMAIRPAWDGRQFVPRRMMNLSCSFDHRVIDGWDAAVFVQRLKVVLETPALLFLEPDR